MLVCIPILASFSIFLENASNTFKRALNSWSFMRLNKSDIIFWCSGDKYFSANLAKFAVLLIISGNFKPDSLWASALTFPEPTNFSTLGRVLSMPALLYGSYSSSTHASISSWCLSKPLGSITFIISYNLPKYISKHSLNSVYIFLATVGSE